MTEMNTHALDQGAWTEVSSGHENVAITTMSVELFAAHVGQVAPAVDAPHILGGAERSAAFAGLLPADKVFVRALNAPLTVTVTRG
jgi:hypothetical protein